MIYVLFCKKMFTVMIRFNARAMIMAGALSVTPVRPSVLYVQNYVRMSVPLMSAL